MKPDDGLGEAAAARVRARPSLFVLLVLVAALGAPGCDDASDSVTPDAGTAVDAALEPDAALDQGADATLDPGADAVADPGADAAPPLPDAAPLLPDAAPLPVDDLVLPDALDGPHAVGHLVRVLTDPVRPEPLSDAPDDFRRLLLDVWYPAALERPLHRAAPLPDALWALLTDFPADGPDRVHLLAFEDQPVAEGPWPVLVYSHGLGGLGRDSVDLVQSLASRGFVVVGVHHTYYAALVVFPDGDVVPGDPIPGGAAVEAWLAAAAETWRADMVAVLDALDAWAADAADPLGAALDLDRTGLFGYSFGGSTSYDICGSDERCDAALNIDGTFFGALVPAYPKPFMLIQASANHGDPTRQPIWLELTEGYRISVADALHGGFSMIYRLYSFFLPDVDTSGSFGTIDVEALWRIRRDYVGAFFDFYLRALDSPLLDGPSDAHPEVYFESR